MKFSMIFALVGVVEIQAKSGRVSIDVVPASAGRCRSVVGANQEILLISDKQGLCPGLQE